MVEAEKPKQSKHIKYTVPSVNGKKSVYNKGVVNETLFMEARGGLKFSGGNPGLSGTITKIEFDYLNTKHKCKRWGNTKYKNLYWIW